MSRTGSGQPWTPKNSGRKIMFGGVYPTVMAASGAAHAVGEALPPYQKLQPRKIYKKYDAPQLQNNVYAGGFRVNVSTGARQEGGYWHNDGNLAISWLNDLLYIGGNWGFSGASPNPGYSTVAAAMVSATEVVMLWRKLESSPTRYNYRITRAKINGVSGDEISMSFIIGSNVNVGDFAVDVQVTGFDSTAHKIATMETSGFNQTVTLHTFAANYASKSSTVILTRTGKSVNNGINDTVSGTTDWTITGSGNYTANTGGPMIERIQMEQQNIGLLSSLIDTASGTYNRNAKSCSGRDGFDHIVKIYTVNYSIIAEKLAFSGAVSTTQTISGFSEYVNDNFKFDYTDASSTATLTWSLSAINKAPRVSAFSAKHAAIFLTKAEHDKSTGRNGTNSTLTTTITEQWDFKNHFNSTLLSTDHYSTTSSVTGSSTVITNELAFMQALAPTIALPGPFRVGTAGEELQAAIGKTNALAHFIVDDPYSSAMPQYSLAVLLKDASYQFTAETVIAAGATFTSPIAVISL